MMKLIAQGLDGTVLDSQKNIEESTIKAIAKTRQQGIKVILATGRIGGEAANFATQLGTDDQMIVAGGAAIASLSTRKNISAKLVANRWFS